MEILLRKILFGEFKSKQIFATLARLAAKKLRKIICQDTLTFYLLLLNK